MADLEFQVTSDSSQARRDLSRLDSSITNIETSVGNVSNSLSRVGAAIRTGFALLTGGAAVTGLARTTDTIRNLDSQLRLATQSQAGFIRAQRDVNRITIATRGNLSAVGNLYARLSRTSQNIGASQADVARATEAVSNTLRISGRSAAEASGALLQLGQALASGTLRGDELNSVLEGIPRLGEAIADELGVLPGQLREIARTGAITSEVVFRAILSQSEQINEEASQIALTYGAALNQLNNGITVFLSGLDMSLGISEGLSIRIERIGIFLNNLGLQIPSIFSLLQTRAGVAIRSIRRAFDRLSITLSETFGINIDILDTAQSLRERVQDLISRAGTAIYNVIFGDPEMPDAGFFRRAQTAIGDLGSLVWTTLLGDPENNTPSLFTRIQTSLTDFGSLVWRTLIGEPEGDGPTLLQRAQERLTRIGSLIWTTIFGDPENDTPSLLTRVQNLLTDFGTLTWTTLYGDPENGTPSLRTRVQNTLSGLGSIAWNTIFGDPETGTPNLLIRAQMALTDFGDLVWTTIFGEPGDSDQGLLQRVMNQFDRLRRNISLFWETAFAAPEASEDSTVIQRVQARLDSIVAGLNTVFGFSLASPDLEMVRMSISDAFDSLRMFVEGVTGINFMMAYASIRDFVNSVRDFFRDLLTDVITESYWTDLVEAVNNTTFADALSTIRDFAEQVRASFIRLFNTITGQNIAINFSNPDLADAQREREAEEGEMNARRLGFDFSTIGDTISDAFNDLTILGLSPLQATLTTLLGTVFIGGLLIGSIRRRIMSAFGFLIRNAYRLALANPVIASIVLAETFGQDVANLISRADFTEFGNTIGRVLTGQLTLRQLLGISGDAPLETVAVVASFDPSETGGGEGSGTLALGAAIGRAAIDTIRGAIGSVFEGEGLSDTISNTFENSMELALVAAFGLATVSSAFRNVVRDGVVDVFTGFGQPGFTGVGDTRRPLNLDLAEDQRIFQRQQAFAVGAGAIGALIAGSTVSELGGSDYAVVGSAMAGQILGALAGSAVISRVNFGELGLSILRAFTNARTNASANLAASRWAKILLASSSALAFLKACLLYTSPSPRDS